jgi:hypothetical protein
MLLVAVVVVVRKEMAAKVVVELAVAVVVALVVEVEVAVAGGVPSGPPIPPKMSTIILITLSDKVIVLKKSIIINPFMQHSFVKLTNVWFFFSWGQLTVLFAIGEV